jgi:hypothetical protein
MVMGSYRRQQNVLRSVGASAIINEGALCDEGACMALINAIWDLPDDPDGNVQHIADHGLTPIDVEYVLNHPQREATSRSSGRPIVYGFTPSGEYILVIYEVIDEGTVYPVTAYPVEE